MCCSCPNAALRWSPERDAAATKAGGVTSVLVPRGGRGGRGGGRGGGREVSIGRGSRQTVYVLGADGSPRPVQITVGESNGSVTEVTGGDLREGQEVITSRLAAGQIQDKSDRSGQARRPAGAIAATRQSGRDGQCRPAPAAPANPAATRPSRVAGAAPPVQNQAAPAARRAAEPAAAGAGPGGQNVRDMTPEQRRAYFQSLTPEQRAAMRERAPATRSRAAGGGAARWPVSRSSRCAGSTKTYGSGATAFQALKGVDLDIAAGDFVAVMGAVRLGQVDGDEHPRLPRHADGRLRSASRASRSRALDRDQRALLRRRYLGFVFQGFNLLARTDALENVELPLALSRRGQARRGASWRMAALDKVGLDGLVGPYAGRAVAAASSSASPSPARSSPSPTCCSPTSRPAISTRETLDRDHGAADRASTANCGITVLMVTHEPDMAAYARTIVHFRDGLIERIEHGMRTGAEVRA